MKKLITIVSFLILANITAWMWYHDSNHDTFSDVVDKTKSSVVHIFVLKRHKATNNKGKEIFYNMPATGSGVIWDSDGYIITNHHVITDSEIVYVTLDNGKFLEADIIAFDQLMDIGIIKIDTTLDNVDIEPIEIGDSDDVKVGDRTLLLGSPYGFAKTVTAGIISSKDRYGVTQWDIKKYLQTDAAMNHGSSGGAMVSMDGELIGINTMIYSNHSDFSGVGLSIPSNLVTRTVEQLFKYGKIEKSSLGISLKELGIDERVELNIQNVKGIVIGRIRENSLGARIPLQENDVIIELCNQEINDPVDLILAGYLTRPGTGCIIKYYHDGNLNQKFIIMEKQFVLNKHYYDDTSIKPRKHG